MTRPSDSNNMRKAIAEARKTMNAGRGGPFGALITDAEGTALAVTANTVLEDHDPTAHAEINAIRQAGRALGTHDLSGCILYATGYPCPMCLGAIIWANIRDVYFGCTPEDAAAIGFRDDLIYQFIRGDAGTRDILRLHPLDREETLRLFAEYEQSSGTIY